MDGNLFHKENNKMKLPRNCNEVSLPGGTFNELTLTYAVCYNCVYS